MVGYIPLDLRGKNLETGNWGLTVISEAMAASKKAQKNYVNKRYKELRENEKSGKDN